MKKLNETDFVIYDQKNDELLCFLENEDIIIYGSKEEAEADLYSQGEKVVSCLELPLHWQSILLNQINN